MGVLPGVGGGPVRVHPRHQPQLHAAVDARVASAEMIRTPAHSFPWMQPTTSILRLASIGPADDRGDRPPVGRPPDHHPSGARRHAATSNATRHRQRRRPRQPEVNGIEWSLAGRAAGRARYRPLRQCAQPTSSRSETWPARPSRPQAAWSRRCTRRSPPALRRAWAGGRSRPRDPRRHRPHCVRLGPDGLRAASRAGAAAAASRLGGAGRRWPRPAEARSRWRR